MTDGVGFGSGGSWRKRRLDGGYFAEWRASAIGRGGPAERVARSSLSSNQSSAAAFDLVRPGEPGGGPVGSDRSVRVRAGAGTEGRWRAW